MKKLLDKVCRSVHTCADKGQPDSPARDGLQTRGLTNAFLFPHTRRPTRKQLGVIKAPPRRMGTPPHLSSPPKVRSRAQDARHRQKRKTLPLQTVGAGSHRPDSFCSGVNAPALLTAPYRSGGKTFSWSPRRLTFSVTECWHLACVRSGEMKLAQGGWLAGPSEVGGGRLLGLEGGVESAPPTLGTRSRLGPFGGCF